MTVLYYTNTSYADFALEIVNELKKHVKLHLIIELSPENKSGTIISTSSLEGKPVVCDPPAILTKECLEEISHYFDGCASVKFYIQTAKKTFTPRNFLSARKLWKHISSIQTDLIHFDTITQRSLGLIPYLFAHFRKKIVLALHDPVPHTNEVNWRFWLTTKLSFPLAGTFLFYSEYSRKAFHELYGNIRKNSIILRMKPYRVYNKFLTHDFSPKGEYILFFGRVSYYKGIDVLLKAIPAILVKFPHIKFVLAGSNFPGYSIDESLLSPVSENIILKNYFISPAELVALIEKSCFVVCPYREATQSGVLMTSFACSRSVIASNVGAFPEYITEGINGKIFEADNPASLTEAILNMLENENYVAFNQAVYNETLRNNWSGNMEVLMKAYHTILLENEQ